MQEFDVSSMKAGDSFVGCLSCGHQVPSGHLPEDECPACLLSEIHQKMSIIKVTYSGLEVERQWK